MRQDTNDAPAVTAGGEGRLAERLFAGPGEMRARCQALDWAATPLGPVGGWPQSLRTSVGLCLASGFPMLVMWGPELVQVYNDAFRSVLQAKHPAGLGQRARDCWPELWTMIGPMYQGVLDTGVSIFLEDQLFTPERRGEPGVAEEAYFTFSYSAIPDEASRRAGILATVFETTLHVLSRDERERAIERANAELRAAASERERLLVESEAARARVTATLESIGDAFYAVDADFRFTYVNRQTETFWGRSRETLLGRHYWSEFPQAVGSEAYEQHLAVMRERRPARLEAVSPILGRWVDVSLYPDPVGGGLACYFRDITDRKTAEAALRESEGRFRTVQDASLFGFAIHRPVREGGRADGRVVDFTTAYLNDAAVRIAGRSRERVLAGTVLEIWPGTDPEGIFADYVRVLETGEPSHRELLLYEHEGIMAGLSFTAVRIGEGPTAEIAATFADITTRLRAAQERDRLFAAAQGERDAATRARAEAEAANRAKSEFLAVMSHELRTPLNAIGGYAELIELGIHGPVTDAQRTALARIQASQRHLLGLIAGVLDYSRVEAGAVTYRLVDVPVAEAVAEAETLVAPQLRAQGLGYAWSGAAPGLCVRADREKLQQILLNLLGNAVKFTHARGRAPGRIDVACTAEAGDGATPGGGRVRIEVRDTGEGIAADALERIFEPFVQVDQRLTRPHAGVGLGLAISRDLARGMGGDLTAESALGVGSTFTLTLPVS